MLYICTVGNAWALSLSSEAVWAQPLSSHEQQMICVLDVSGVTITWHLKTATGIATGSTLAPAVPGAVSAISQELCMVFQSWEITSSLFAWLTWFSLCGFVSMVLLIQPFLSLPENQELNLWINLGLKKIFLFNWEVNWGTQEISKADWNQPCTWSNTGTAASLMLLEIPDGELGFNLFSSLSVFFSYSPLWWWIYFSHSTSHAFTLVRSELTAVQHSALHNGLILLLFQFN